MHRSVLRAYLLCYYPVHILHLFHRAQNAWELMALPAGFRLNCKKIKQTNKKHLCLLKGFLLWTTVSDWDRRPAISVWGLFDKINLLYLTDISSYLAERLKGKIYLSGSQIIVTRLQFCYKILSSFTWRNRTIVLTINTFNLIYSIKNSFHEVLMLSSIEGWQTEQKERQL